MANRHASPSLRWSRVLACVGLAMAISAAAVDAVTAQTNELYVDTGIVELAKLGFDIDLLDRIEHNSDAAFVPEESEVFEEFFSVINRMNDGKTSEVFCDAPLIDLVELARQPRRNAGHVFMVSGTLRRITPVQVDSESLRKEIGNEYFQLDVFIPLDNQHIVLSSKDKKELRITGSFGITVLLAHLPEAVQRSELPIRIELPAYYLKNWRHKTSATRDLSSSMKKPGLIFVGLPGQLRIVEGTVGQGFSRFLIPAFWAGLVAVLAGLFFWSRNRGASFHDRRRQQTAPDLTGALGDLLPRPGGTLDADRSTAIFDDSE